MKSCNVCLAVHEHGQELVAELGEVVGLLFEGVLLLEDGGDGGLVGGEGLGVGEFGLHGSDGGGGDFLEGGAGGILFDDAHVVTDCEMDETHYRVSKRSSSACCLNGG